MERNETVHPPILGTLTSTQMAELQRQFDQGDRTSFDVHIDSYGLDRVTGETVWNWFAADATDGLAIPVNEDDHTRGPEDAPVTLVVYGDYQCPYTRRALQAITRLEHRVGDRFRLIYRHFPLREIHPNAQAAAELAEAAGARGKFWEMHERLFARQDDLDPFHLSAYATELGIADEESDWQVEAGHRYADRVEEDLQGGLRSGVGGTPTIYVNGWRHRGAHDEATLQRAIELAG